MTKQSPSINAMREATLFASSQRGQYIISQALCVAIKTMEKEPRQHREVSNIDDMKFLRDNLFPIFHIIESMTPNAELIDQLERKMEKKRR